MAYRPLRMIIVSLLVMALLYGYFCTSTVRAAIGSTIDNYPSSLANDSTTPIAAYVTFTGLTENTTYRYKLKYATSSGYTWNPSTTTWVANNKSASNFPTFTTGAGQTTRSLWIYMRSAASGTTGTFTMQAGVTTGTSFTYGTGVSMTVLDMSSGCPSNCGGWVEETTGTARAGRAVAVKSGSSVVGLYVAEDNSVSEGFPSTTGYYKVAVPTCSTCNYGIETWDLSNPGTVVGNANTMPDQDGDNTVGAGQTTTLNFSTPTVIRLNSLEARSSNHWLVRCALAAGLGMVVVSASLVAQRSRRVVRRVAQTFDRFSKRL